MYHAFKNGDGNQYEVPAGFRALDGYIPSNFYGRVLGAVSGFFVEALKATK